MKEPCNILIYLLARPRGIEPLTKNLEGSCSIQLSYGRTCQGAEPCRVAANIVIAPHCVKRSRAFRHTRPCGGVCTVPHVFTQTQGKGCAGFAKARPLTDSTLCATMDK